jgi:hypothetical protein
MPRAVALWDTLLRAGRRVTAIGVSDWHRGDSPIGSASVRVWANELSTRAIIDGIRAGRVVVMIDAATQPPDVRVTSGTQVARIGDTITVEPGDPVAISVTANAPLYAGAQAELFWNGERVATAPLIDNGVRFDRFASTDGYLRLHVLAANGTPVAVTNPVWIRTSAR